ncbi:hypothetical protein PBY51_023785 [Eleginops maclovinus]|uniref:Fibronectin type-III domain-containing protein n=1 Tax=Eleginops maclovinus TaxID=56733 RepID=A0AAN7X0N5_ELEMC|nr:hypothetical protein PBY51_023785 [Eleginops maclovinus]
MVGRGFLFSFLHSKCTSCAINSYSLLLGMIFVNYITLSAHVQASSSVNCKSQKLSSKYQHCGINPAGVHDLDCFFEHRSSFLCVWKPGNSASEKRYTLIIEQNNSYKLKYCNAFYNITKVPEGINLYEKYNISAEVFENSASTNCTKAVFRGSPKSLFRCGPTHNVFFSRHSGKLDVSVRWQNEDVKAVRYYSVRYKALGSLSWSKSLVRSKNGEKCTVENLNSSVVYSVQIQCVTNDKCSQCPWSKAYTVPAELTTQPVMVNMEETDIAKTKGRRLISLTWKFPAKELNVSYHVTIGKASGEAPCQRVNTTVPEIRLALSYSEYHLNISAVNNASTSPAVRQTIPQREDAPSKEAGMLNVTVHTNTSFTVYWKDDLKKNYVCYSVEWMEKGHKAAFMSFYEDENNYRTFTSLPESLMPYKRYSITLHTRPDKDTCNMKKVNNSESTYGRTHFYFIEGYPVSAPTNISIYNVTLNTVVLQWLPIPVDDIRGFLLGYIIYCTEYHHRGSTTERNITVDPMSNSYELGNLKQGTAYGVQISGFTEARVGVRSTAIVFKTNYQELSNLIAIIAIFAVIGIVLIFGSPVIKRAKVILWPSIPNPGKSNAMQKIEEPCELELLGSINHLKVEEWDTNSLKIVKKEVIPAGPLTSMLPVFHASDDEEDSTEMTCNWIQGDTGDSTEEIPSDINEKIIPDIKMTDPQSSPFTFPCDYTTIEMFQQGIPQSMPVRTSVTQDTESEPEDKEWTVGKSGLDYISQFSTSPTLDSKEISTIL